MSQQQQPIHWRDRSINASEGISDAFEVLKAYGARIAEWVLFFCLIANIIEIFPLPEPFAAMFGNIVLGIQVVTLDIAGFGLKTMGDHALRRGDTASARKAQSMGWTLISIMILTVGLVATSIIFPDTKHIADDVNKALMLVRIVVTVLYGHVVHGLRTAGVAHENRVRELEEQVSSVQSQLKKSQQEVSSLGVQLSGVQSQLDREKARVSSVQSQLDRATQTVSSLECELSSGHGDTVTLSRDLNTAQVEVESLRARLAAKSREVEEMRTDQAGAIDMRRDLNAARLDAEDLRAQLEAKTREVSSVQLQVSNLRREVSSLGVQSPARKVSSVQSEVSTGHAKVVQLDSRRKTGQDDAEGQIRALHKGSPVQSLSARAIAGQVGCSPTTAAKWKAIIEDEEKAM